MKEEKLAGAVKQPCLAQDQDPTLHIYCLTDRSWQSPVIYSIHVYKIQVATERKRVEDEPSQNYWEISVKLPDGTRINRKFPLDGSYQVKYI